MFSHLLFFSLASSLQYHVQGNEAIVNAENEDVNGDDEFDCNVNDECDEADA